MRYEEKFTDYFSKMPIFTFKDASRFLNKMGASDAYVKLFMHNQAKRKKLHRVGKGYYTSYDGEEVIGFAFSPFYYGLEYSMTLHKLWSQVSIPVILTATKAVPGIRNSMGKRIMIRRISKQMFFGIEYIRYNEIFIPVSDIEKTLLDFAYFGIKLSDIDMKNILCRCNMKKLMEYANRCSKRVKREVISSANRIEY